MFSHRVLVALLIAGINGGAIVSQAAIPRPKLEILTPPPGGESKGPWRELVDAWSETIGRIVERSSAITYQPVNHPLRSSAAIPGVEPEEIPEWGGAILFREPASRWRAWVPRLAQRFAGAETTRLANLFVTRVRADAKQRTNLYFAAEPVAGAAEGSRSHQSFSSLQNTHDFRVANHFNRKLAGATRVPVAADLLICPKPGAKISHDTTLIFEAPGNNSQDWSIHHGETRLKRNDRGSFLTVNMFPLHERGGWHYSVTLPPYGPRTKGEVEFRGQSFGKFVRRLRDFGS